MKNVYLIDLASGSNMNLLPLSIGLVGSYSMAQLDLAETFDFNFQFLRGEHRAKVDAMIDPTVVGFACYIWNVQGSLRLARFVKQRFPATKIVLGGFSIPKVPETLKAYSIPPLRFSPIWLYPKTTIRQFASGEIRCINCKPAFFKLGSTMVGNWTLQIPTRRFALAIFLK